MNILHATHELSPKNLGGMEIYSYNIAKDTPAMKIRQENLLIADYKSMQSLVNGALLRTTVFVDEF